MTKNDDDKPYTKEEIVEFIDNVIAVKIKEHFNQLTKEQANEFIKNINSKQSVFIDERVPF